MQIHLHIQLDDKDSYVPALPETDGLDNSLLYLGKHFTLPFLRNIPTTT